MVVDVKYPFFPLAVLILLAALTAYLSNRVVEVPNTVPTVLPTLSDQTEAPSPWRPDEQQPRTEMLRDRVSFPLYSSSDSGATTSSAAVAANSFNERAVGAVGVGAIVDALKLFELALATDPEHAEAHSHYGRLLTRMAAYKAALPHLERAAALQPENPQVWLDLHTLYEKTTDLARAYSARKQVRELTGGWPVIKDDNGFWVLAGTSLP